MTRVLLLRHAETATPHVFHGFESDIDLSPRGHLQAAAIAPVVAALRPDILVCSDMLRARLTGQVIADACGVPLRVEPDLHERKVGSLQGTPVTWESGPWADTLARWVGGATDFAPGDAESFDQIRQRVLPVFERITRENKGKTIAIVAHGIVIRVLILSIAEGYNAADWHRLGRVSNVSLTELVGDGARWQAVRIGHESDEVRKLHEAEGTRSPGSA